jgi:hypothetical protein
MAFLRVSRIWLRGLGGLFALAFPGLGTAHAHDHQKVMYVPVQAAPVMAVPVMAAPVAPVQWVQFAPVSLAPVAPVKLGHHGRLPAAAVPVVSYAPVQTTQAVQLVPAQTAPAAAPLQATTQAVAAAPLSYGGYYYYQWPTQASAAAAPGTATKGPLLPTGTGGQLSEADRATIVQQLKGQADALRAAGWKDSDIRAQNQLLPAAQSAYSQATNINYVNFTPNDNQNVQSLIDQALGATTTTTANNGSSGSTTTGGTPSQAVLAPVYPTYYYVPVQVNKHGYLRLR